MKSTPAQQHRSDGEPRADRGEQHEIAPLQPSVATASASASGIVAAVVLPYISRLMTTLSIGQSEAFGGGGDDPAVGLVRDEQVELRRLDAVALEQPRRDLFASCGRRT